MKDRLLDDMDKNVLLVANKYHIMVTNKADETFNNHTYWELIISNNGKEMPDEQEEILV